MHRVLIAGLPTRLSSWLAQRLEGVTLEMAFTGEEMLDLLREGGWSLLVADAALEGGPVDDLLRRARAIHGLERLPVLVAVDPEAGADAARLHRLTDELRIDRILLHPLDRGELARDAATLLQQAPPTAPRPEPRSAPAPAPPLGAPAPPPAGPSRAQVEAALAGVWERARPAVAARMDAVERAIVATVDGSLTAGQRREAEAEAHRLAGALGTFGSPDGTRLARQIEHALSGSTPLTRPDGARLARLAAALRAEVEALGPGGDPAPAPAPAAGEGERRDPRPLLLAIGLDGALARALEAEAAARGMRLRAATDAARARVSVGVERPEAVILDLAAADGDGGADLLPELGKALSGAPVLVLAERGSLPDRVRLLQMGARRFVQKPASAAEVLDAAAALLPQAGAAPRRILAVDDDPQILAALRVLLEPERLAVHTLDDPLGFWRALEEVRPDLVVLDVDMPYLSGIELCRVVRADHRWSRLPVLFLTAHTDRETLLRVFAAGADDYVTKPIVGPELSARIRTRLDRAAP